VNNAGSDLMGVPKLPGMEEAVDGQDPSSDGAAGLDGGDGVMLSWPSTVLILSTVVRNTGLRVAGCREPCDARCGSGL
jgi:hypothetical protein